ncbi:cytochrome oxidase assembly protein ShyY1 [Haloactinopolyspora alba]|uniref:SURF1-like protein n=1 Tax=Haloactinopolyspora alba TaxID=648780 RepID=A0A2P8E2E7_9ACTN|nr:SURF1 family protein [Haloactinopolyspora alba]PSL03644.1 cytochrome oxidase assembly protein ShyY1 [Haloactinopolyspora alba]
MYRFLASRRWLVRTIAGILLVLVCVRLGIWQLDRNEQRTAHNDVVEANVDDDAVPIDRLAAPGAALADDDQWRTVQVTGRYDTDNALILRLRPVNGVPGVHALTPLVTDDGNAVLVDRGYVASEGTRDDEVPIPPPPEGRVTVTGRARTSETGQGTGGDAARGDIRYVDIAGIAETMPYPLYGAWIERTAQDPAGSGELRTIPAPETESGPHLSYAVQWFLFAVVGVSGYVLLVRAEARGRAEAAAEPGHGDSSGPGEDSGDHAAGEPAARAHGGGRDQVDR